MRIAAIFSMKCCIVPLKYFFLMCMPWGSLCLIQLNPTVWPRTTTRSLRKYAWSTSNVNHSDKTECTFVRTHAQTTECSVFPTQTELFTRNSTVPPILTALAVLSKTFVSGCCCMTQTWSKKLLALFKTSQRFQFLITGKPRWQKISL